jgi:hypothetical protein
MKRATVLGILATMLGAYGVPAQNTPSATSNAVPKAVRTVDTGAAALRQAADAKQYLFVFLYEQNDGETKAARKTFDAGVRKVTPAAKSVAVDRSDPSEAEIVEKLKLEKAPVPMVLAIAPNGAITGTVKAADLTEERLLGTVASAALQQCLKAVQDGQVVLLCLQNPQTKDNDAAMKGVKAVKADKRFSETTDIIQLDPADAKEAKLMAQLKVDPKTKKAVTVVLAPPGVLVTKMEGGTTLKELVAALQKAAECCAGTPGCCAGH